jgi:putative oxidoreductase
MSTYRSSAAENSTLMYDAALLLVRITVSCLIMTHGLQKLMMLLGSAPVEFADPIGIGPVPSLILAIFAEVVCSFLIVIGIATRLSCIPLIVTMLVAIFYVHATDPLEAKELPVLYLLVFVVFFVTGAGKFSVDYLIRKNKKSINY